MSAASPPLAVTMGEPAGIGGELTLKCWMARDDLALPTFFTIDDPARLRRLAERLGWNTPIVEIDAADAAADSFANGVPVLPNPVPGSMTPGQPDPKNARSVLASIRIAVDMVRHGQAAAVITNPIHKKSLYEAGFGHPGHTEYLAELSGVDRSVMMLMCPGLRVVPATIHMSLAEAIAALDTDEIIEISKVTEAALRRDFGIDRPHLAIAALNPHGGEEGAMGREEKDIIAPAVEALKKLGFSVSGPAPADTLFHDRARETYDAAICMYHDQAQIPLKTIDFSGGVNVTLGLPFVRASPDHGTAFEIAGTGVADTASLTAALRTARDMVRCRAAHGPRDRSALA